MGHLFVIEEAERENKADVWRVHFILVAITPIVNTDHKFAQNVTVSWKWETPQNVIALMTSVILKQEYVQDATMVIYSLYQVLILIL